jgi:hypothetical protein
MSGIAVVTGGNTRRDHAAAATVSDEATTIGTRAAPVLADCRHAHTLPDFAGSARGRAA